MNKLALVCAFTLGLVSMNIAHAESPSLKTVMQHLGMEMHRISDGLLVADFETVARAARTIAEHGHMGAADERRIEQALGRDVRLFRQADELVHHRALKLAEAALSRSTLAVQRYADLMDGCIACHSRFRERLRTP